MGRRKILIVSLLCASVAISYGQTKTPVERFREIVPLKTTEAEVVRLFGKESRRLANSARYELDGADLEVIFSTGLCRNKKSQLPDDDYDAPAGTVIYATLSFDTPISLLSLGLKLSDFTREEVSDLPDVSVFSSKKLGISVGLQGDEVDYFALRPAESLYKAECK